GILLDALTGVGEDGVALGSDLGHLGFGLGPEGVGLGRHRPGPVLGLPTHPLGFGTGVAEQGEGLAPDVVGGTVAAAVAPPPGPPDSQRDRPDGKKFTFDMDAVDLAQTLEASGRYRRDTRLGGILHGRKVSMREVAPEDSVHLVMEGNRLHAHVDRYSPLNCE